MENSDPIFQIQVLVEQGANFEGKLFFDGHVRVDGTVIGMISGGEILVVGENAEIDAEIDVDVLVVLGGTVRGKIEARQLVELHQGGSVFADIVSPQLVIEKGAVFEGNSRNTKVHSVEAISVGRVQEDGDD